jgi:dolichol kinase
VLAFVSTQFLFIGTDMSLIQLTAFSVFSGAIGAGAESSFKRLDDNLVMPLLSATGIWLLLKLF